MQKQIPFQIRMKQTLTDLNPVLAGEAQYVSRNETDPFESRELYVIHYVRCGHGILNYKGIKYPLRAGQFFILPPGEIAHFYSKSDEPWALRWVGFNGALAYRFSELPPVVDAPPGTFLNLCDLNGSDYLLEYKLSSELLFLFSALLTPPKQKQHLMTDSVEWVKEYVKKNYMNHISVVSIAAELGLDPDYLTRKFKKKVNMNIQTYILHTRITNARQLLVQGYSVTEAAAMCGFNDASGFCRAFKKYDSNNQSPSQWQRYVAEIHQQRQTSELPPKP